MNGKKVVGIDLAKRTFESVRMQDGEKDKWYRGKTGQGDRMKFYEYLDADDIVILEAGSMAFLMAKEIKKYAGCEVYVLNPSELHIIFKSLKKNDKEDAKKLARLGLRNPIDELPLVPVPSDSEEKMRRLVARQAYLKRDLTQQKNRLHGLFVKAGIVNIKKSELAGKANREKTVEQLPGDLRDEAYMLMEVMNMLERQLKKAEQDIKKQLKANPGYTNLVLSMPGIGPIMAASLLAYVGDGKRFTKPNQISYYAGLVPKLKSSGEMMHHGHILQKGCKALRRNAVQSANGLLTSRYQGPLRDFYDRISKRRGKKIAKVALARKMLETIYVMLSTGEMFRDSWENMLPQKLKYYGLT